MNREIIGLFAVLLIGTLMISGCVTEEITEIEKPTIPEPEATEGAVLKLAVQPSMCPEKAFAMFNPLTDYLSKETGLNIELTLLETEEEFHGQIDKFDFILQDSFSSYVHKTNFDPLVIVVSKEGELEEMGAIIVRADSNITNMSDLKGKTFLFGDAHSAPKFLAPFATIKESGVDPDNDLEYYTFGGQCCDNAMSVYLGEYDAGVVCQGFVTGEKGHGTFSFETDLRFIANTVPVPLWIMVASKNADKETVDKVKKALLELSPENPLAEEVLRNTEWGGFIEVTGNELMEVDELVQEYSIPLLED